MCDTTECRVYMDISHSLGHFLVLELFFDLDFEVRSPESYIHKIFCGLNHPSQVLILRLRLVWGLQC